MGSYRVHAITFEGDVVTINYLSSDDIRVEGMVGIAHQVQLSLEHPDYAEDVTLVERQISRLLRNVLEDWEDSTPWVPEDDTEDYEMGSRKPVS